MNDCTLRKVLICAGAISVMVLAASLPAMGSGMLAKFEPPDGYAYMGTVVLYTDPAVKDPSLPSQWESLTGHKAAVMLGFRYFTAYDTFGNISSNNHPEASFEWCAAHGVTPMITWQPDRSNMAQYKGEDAIQAIANGNYDSYIKARADECKAYGKPIFIRMGHEFNFGGYAWSKHPEAYATAWQRVVNIFRQEGATNVAFVWCANFPSVDYPSGLTTIDQYYPGDAYVDWVGMDCYNIPNWERNFTRMVSGFYQKYCVQKDKPMYIGEMGSSDTLTNDPSVNKGWPVSKDALNKAQWISCALNDIATKYPMIKGVTYWNDSIHGGSYALTGASTWSGKTDRLWAKYYFSNSRYLTSVRSYTTSPTPSVTPKPTVSPSPAPAKYAVYSAQKWATYNGKYAPIGQFTVKPGTTVKQSVYFENRGNVQDSYAVTVSGIPSTWYTVSLYGKTTVNPGEGRYGDVFIKPSRAGDYTFTVKVTSKVRPTISSSQTYTVHVK
jgi:hypothetical protein